MNPIRLAVNRVIYRQMDLQRMRKGLSNGLDWDGRSLPAERRRLSSMYETSATRESSQLAQRCTESYQENRLDVARNIHLLWGGRCDGEVSSLFLMSGNNELVDYGDTDLSASLYLWSAVLYLTNSTRIEARKFIRNEWLRLVSHQKIIKWYLHTARMIGKCNNASVNRKENAFEVIISMQFLETSRRISPFLIYLSSGALHHRHHVLPLLTYITLDVSITLANEAFSTITNGIWQDVRRWYSSLENTSALILLY